MGPHPLELRPQGPAWRDGATPWSERYGDGYHNRKAPLLQAEQAFVRGAELPGLACGQLETHHRHGPLVGEIGFGAGLNFLVSLRYFLRAAPPGRQLHYLAFDEAIWPASAMLRLHRQLGLAAEGEMLARALPPTYGGVHRLELADGRVQLTLVLGDARRTLPVWAEDAERRGYRCDAWYLDGFAPDRNPQPWQPEVLACAARMTAPGGLAVSWTAAGAVRAALAELGFRVERVAGVAGKRHRIVARMAGARKTRRGLRLPTVRIAGAGLAGAATAAALARTGCEVQVADPAAGGDLSARSLPWSLMRWRPSASASPGALFRLATWRYSRAFLQSRPGCMPTPVLELVATRRSRSRAARLGKAFPEWLGSAHEVRRLDLAQGLELAGAGAGELRLDGDGNAGSPVPDSKGKTLEKPYWLLLRHGFLARPRMLREQLLEEAGAVVRPPSDPQANHGGLPNTDDGLLHVWAAGCNGPLAAWGREEPGQMRRAPLADASGPLPALPLAGHGWRYRARLSGRGECLVASDRGVLGLPAEGAVVHSGVRHRSHDNLPLVGPLAPEDANLWAMTGFGGFGLLQIPLCARLVADRWAGLPPPLDPRLEAALRPTGRQAGGAGRRGEYPPAYI